jgi:hypothetical protein
MVQAAIERQLDSALLTSEEMAKYVARWCAASPDPPHVGAPAAAPPAP